MKRDAIPDVITFLRDDERCRFGCLIDICGVDYPEREERFDVVYHLLSPWLNHRIRVRAKTDAETPVPSIVADVPRRQLVRARGISTSTASCLTAIRTCAGSSPTTASRAIPCARTSRSPASWSSATTIELKRVVYEPVKLMQEFRNFDFLSPWEAMDTAIPGDEKAGVAPDRKGDT